MKELHNEAIEIYKLAKEKANDFEWEESVNLFLKSARLFEDTGDFKSAARAYGRVAWNSIPIKKYDDVTKYLERSIELDFDQSTANFLWAARLYGKWKHVDKTEECFLESVSMLYNEMKFSYKELKRQKEVLKEDVWLLIRQVIEKFYNKKVREEKWRHRDWAESDKVRINTIMKIREDILPNDYMKFSKSYGKAKLLSDKGLLDVLYFLSLTKEKDKVSDIKILIGKALPLIPLEYIKVGGANIEHVFNQLKKEKKLNELKNLLNIAYNYIFFSIKFLSPLQGTDFENRLKDKIDEILTMKVNEIKFNEKKFSIKRTLLMMIPLIFFVLFGLFYLLIPYSFWEKIIGAATISGLIVGLLGLLFTINKNIINR